MSDCLWHLKQSDANVDLALNGTRHDLFLVHPSKVFSMAEVIGHDNVRGS